MRRVGIVASSLAALAVVGGCGSSGGTAGPPTAELGAVRQKVVGLIDSMPDIDRTSQFGQGRGATCPLGDVADLRAAAGYPSGTKSTDGTPAGAWAEHGEGGVLALCIDGGGIVVSAGPDALYGREPSRLAHSPGITVLGGKIVEFPHKFERCLASWNAPGATAFHLDLYDRRRDGADVDCSAALAKIVPTLLGTLTG